jgi:hypothetical protein
MLRNRIIYLVLAACASAPATPASVPATAPASSTFPPAQGGEVDVERAAVDLDTFLAQLEVVHPEPFHGVSREAFVAALDRLKAKLLAIDGQEAMVELMRLVALLSREGRDGHQFVMPFPDAEGPVLPIRVYEFVDGLTITEVAPGSSQDLVGGRLVSMGGHPIGDVLAAVEPLVPRDGPATVPGLRPFFILRFDVLAGLGLIGSGPIPVTVETDSGTVESALDPISYQQFVEWAGPYGFTMLRPRGGLGYLDRTESFRIEQLDEMLYVRYGDVIPPPDGAIEQLQRLAAGSETERVVLDLRHNPGGDNFTYRSLLDVLQTDGIARTGRLFVLTDRITFSAASNLATEIEQTTEATFVGEPMGGGLNFWNDVSFLPLPAYPIPMRVGISTRYWEKSVPGDPRLTIEPDIAVPMISADYFAGRDPVLAMLLSDGR